MNTLKFKIFVVLIILTGVICSCRKSNDKKNIELNYSDKIVLPNHAVPDTMTAIKVAEAILIGNYGISVLNQRPYRILLEQKNDTIWYIQGVVNFNKEPNLISVGGLARIAFRSKDCKIIELSHSE